MKRLPPLNALRAFSVAARCGSMSKAGEALHVTQGAVSRQVKLLEETLGRSLFLRVPQGLKLTEAGALLAEHFGHAFDGIERVGEHLASDQRRLHLRINVPPTFATRWLAPRLTDFRRRHPFVDLQITTHWLQTPCLGREGSRHGLADYLAIKYVLMGGLRR